MLTEISDTRQIPGEGNRRWFIDPDMDLILWYEDGENLSGFQLCYDKLGAERALTWRQPDKYQHNAVDDGHVDGGYNQTPLLVSDGHLDNDRVAAAFLSKAEKLPTELRTFIAEKIKNYPGF